MIHIFQDRKLFVELLFGQRVDLTFALRVGVIELYFYNIVIPLIHKKDQIVFDFIEFGDGSREGPYGLVILRVRAGIIRYD